MDSMREAKEHMHDVAEDMGDLERICFLEELEWSSVDFER